ncbi:hypothetical protein FA95DRAFT_199857 [Auriscalpium vulgare]|uniref:Uncharacterized protein n=1 Tax=Auriscalpium vulgare TaxID=40419 RepID=A0ACB8S6D8_9AGAM|nr:hypothetical protein FA95DRAFT_199857 [Auriscalpium vulgare]
MVKRRKSLWPRPRDRRRSTRRGPASAPPLVQALVPNTSSSSGTREYSHGAQTPEPIGDYTVEDLKRSMSDMSATLQSRTEDLLMLIRHSPLYTAPPCRLSPEALAHLRQVCTPSGLPSAVSAPAAVASSSRPPTRKDKRRDRKRKRPSAKASGTTLASPQKKSTRRGRVTPPDTQNSNDDSLVPASPVPVSPVALPPPASVSFIDDPFTAPTSSRESPRRHTAQDKGKGRASASALPAQRKSVRPRKSANRLPILHHGQSQQSDSDAGPSSRPSKRRRTEGADGRTLGPAASTRSAPTPVDDAGDFALDFQMLDLPDVTSLPWVSATLDSESSAYVPPGVQSLVDGTPAPFLIGAGNGC